MKRTSNYSRFVALLSLLTSTFGVVMLYLYNSPSWIPAGICYMTIASFMLTGLKPLSISLREQHIPNYIYLIIGIVLSFCYFLLSMYGLIVFIDLLPLADKSFSFYPVIAFSFVLLSVCIGIFQEN